MIHRKKFVDMPTPINKNGPSRARVSDVEYEALKALAKYEGINLNAAVRLAIRESTHVRGIWPLIENLPEG